jgi:hypothetical protein
MEVPTGTSACRDPSCLEFFAVNLGLLAAMALYDVVWFQ